jgi:hypothetical protein
MSNPEINSITAIEPVSGMPRMEIVYKPIGWFKEYFRNPRKNYTAVVRMCESIREFGFAIAMLCRSTGEIVDGHLRYKGARKIGLTELPVVICDHWTPAQVKAFRLMVNRSVTWADWDEELLALELQEIQESDFDLSLTGFDPDEIDGLLALEDEEAANAAPPLPESPVSRVGDLWLLGPHRVLCGDATSPEAVSRLLGERKPRLICGCQPVAFNTSLAVAPPGRFSRSRTLAALLPSRAPVAFFALLGALVAGLAFFPDLPFFCATLRARLAPLAFGLAFGASAAGTRAVSSASAVEIMIVLLCWRGFRDHMNRSDRGHKQAKSEAFRGD